MNEHYTVFPKVVPINKDVKIIVSGVHDKTIVPEKEYNVTVQAMCNHYDNTQYKTTALPARSKYGVSELSKGGIIEFAHKFATKGEYTIKIMRNDNTLLTTEQIYVASPELAKLTPYRGDLHIHTYYSDGSMSPIYMAIMGRKLGLDFAAITDHRRYFPSLEAIENAKKIDLDLLLFPGEEIDIGTAHIVSVCANASVVEARGDEESYKRLLTETVENRLKDAAMVENLTKDQYASAKWTVDRIHEFNGYAFLAHPYWVSGNRYDHHLPISDQLLKDSEIDGVEVIGGHWQFQYESNMLAMVKYYEQVAKGYKIPILGNSDTHYNYKIGKDLFGWYWTTAFAKSLNKEDIFDAIFNLRSVACERPFGERFVACGPYELVEYTCFLDREFFPIHDRICSMEADIYFDIMADKEASIEQLNSLRKNLDDLYRNSFQF
jgi:predicted metal-dependent phosphoesterase TrpH